jgi:hypothetical protein
LIVNRRFVLSLVLISAVCFQGAGYLNTQNLNDGNATIAKSIQAENLQSRDPLERKKRIFESASTLLLRRSVPFDPAVLLKDNWQKVLAPVLAQMPEMQETRYGGEQLAGVQLADTLYLPEKVAVTSDVVVLARHLVFEGKNVVIKGNHSISIFTAEKVTVIGKSLPRRWSRRGGRLTESVELPERPPGSGGGHITIDCSGIGYKEWLESIGGENTLKQTVKDLYHHDKLVRDRAKQTFDMLRRGDRLGARAGLTPQGDVTRGTSGGPGSIGPAGSDGAAPISPNPLEQPQASGGVCGGNIHGSNGQEGAAGGNAGDAGTGLQGNPGGGGSGGFYFIPDGDNNTWHFVAPGGQGGQGGPGGFAYSGIKGGTGGKGGNGADCLCSQGGAGNGGIGGKGGGGGDGGNGGDGGKGG